VREIPENFRNGFPDGGTLIKPSAGHVIMSLSPSSSRNTARNLGETDQNESILVEMRPMHRIFSSV
jgi:hypothetical protein